MRARVTIGRIGDAIYATTEREIDAHARQNVCVGSVGRTLCPKMGKCVSLKGKRKEGTEGKYFSEVR